MRCPKCKTEPQHGSCVCDEPLVKELEAQVAELQHEYDSTRGLWCIDRDPKSVTHEWIIENGFQLSDGLSAQAKAKENPYAHFSGIQEVNHGA